MTPVLMDMSRGTMGEILLRFPSYSMSWDDLGIEEMTTTVDEGKIHW
jgi:hypothetical protein